MKKVLILGITAAAAAAVLAAVASKRPIEQPEQPVGEWEPVPERPTS